MTDADATNENVAAQLRERLPKLPPGQFWRVRKVETPFGEARNQSVRLVGKLVGNVVNKGGGDLRVELRENVSSDLARNLGYTRLLADAPVYTRKNTDLDVVNDILNSARQLLRDQEANKVEKNRKDTFTGDFS